jgi:hypothetical protein
MGKRIKLRKNVLNRNFFFLQIIVEEFVKSKNLLQILIKLLDPQITFYKFEINLQIQKSVIRQTHIM